MYFFGRQRLAVISSLMCALILSDCATPSNPGALAPNNPSLRTGQKTFDYTGGKQLFTVPARVKKITITADGASGAGSSYYAGGRGGLVTATITVTPDQELAVFVGGSGDHGGFNGGGAGSIGSSSQASGVGGGASDVRNSATGRRLVDAGGGGGAGAPSGYNTYGSCRVCSPSPSPSPAPSSSSQYGSGGDGGASKGANGHTGGTGSYRTSGGDGGDGGTQTAGGNGGRGGRGSGSCTGKAGDTGRLHKGGSSGGGCFAGGGGGGGGYYGGGGGGGSDSGCGSTYYGEYGYCAWGGGGGGGGGSSFIEKTATNIKNIRGGAPAGDGLVVISW